MLGKSGNNRFQKLNLVNSGVAVSWALPGMLLLVPPGGSHSVYFKYELAIPGLAANWDFGVGAFDRVL